MDTIRLKRWVRVSNYAAILDLGKLREKQSFLSILKLAEENDGKITPELIVEKFFKGRPLNLGKRLIQNCRLIDLFDNKNNITEAGLESLKENMIFEKFNGAYTLWTTKDPLIPQIILDIRDIDIFKMRDSSNKGKTELIPLWLKDLEGTKITLLNDKKEQVKVYEFQNLIKRTNNRLNLTLRFNINPNVGAANNQALVTGDLNKVLDEVPKHTYLDIWLDLLGNEKHKWDLSKNVYMCNFEELTDKERLNFLINITFKQPKVLDLGSFDDVTVKDIPIYPQNEEDANLWANWILEYRIDTYLNKKEYNDLCQSIKEMSIFSDYNIEFPDQDTLAQLFVYTSVEGEIEYPEKFWYLKTPLDLIKGNNRRI